MCTQACQTRRMTYVLRFDLCRFRRVKEAHVRICQNDRLRYQARVHQANLSVVLLTIVQQTVASRQPSLQVGRFGHPGQGHWSTVMSLCILLRKRHKPTMIRRRCTQIAQLGTSRRRRSHRWLTKNRTRDIPTPQLNYPPSHDSESASVVL